MAASNAKDDLGPLPISDRQSELERLSLIALNTALPNDKFKVRDERTDDAGVDVSLELLIDGRSTNLRAQVQLKATDHPKINADASISHSVNTSNLNYLLNGSNPLYVLFVAPSKQLYFAWARDEAARLDKQNSKWMQQSTITLRFDALLTRNSLDEIHERIRREAQLQRRIHNLLGRASMTEQVVIGINPDTLSNTDPDQIYKMLMVGGATCISSGLAAPVLRLFDTLNPGISRTPRLEMIRSYAYYSLGKYRSALAHAAEALLKIDELSGDDQQFVDYLKDACEFQCGSIDLAEYTQRQKIRAEQQTGLFALMYRLDAIRHTFTAAENPDYRQELYEEISSLVESISSSHSSPQFKLQARLTLLHAEGAQAVTQLLHELSYYRMRIKLGQPADKQPYTEVLNKRFGRWEQDMDAIFQASAVQAHPILMGDALNTHVAIRVLKFSTLRAVFNALDETPEAEIYANMAKAEQAVSIHSITESLEGELNAKMLLADLFELAGQNDAAKAMAQGILPKAMAMGYFGLEMRAKAHIAGDTLLARGEARRVNLDNADQDFLLSKSSDDEMLQAARSTWKAIKLPDDRLPVLERCWLAEREIAQQRLGWCQHINLLEELKPTWDAATAYKADPKRHGFCGKYKYESAIGRSDWKIIIEDFKQDFCGGCVSRSPKPPPDGQ